MDPDDIMMEQLQPAAAPKRARNAEKTKATIIAAAQTLFSQRGYTQTGLRDIARLADVSLALPARYFESKAGLFEAALKDALDLQGILSAEKQSFGRNLVEAVLDPDMPITIPAMISLAIGDDQAAAVAREFTRHHIIEPIAKWLGHPHGRARAYVILMISTGFVIYNRHIILDASHPSRSKVGAWLENTIQDIVDGSEQALKTFLRKRGR